MLEQFLRPHYQKIFVDPFANLIINKISPNGVTLLSCLFGIATPLLLVASHAILACVTLLISGYLDTLDGTLARHTHQCYQSNPFGAVLDIVCDRITEFAVVFGLFAVAPMQRGWLTMMMLGSILICITSFLVVGIFTKNKSQKSFHYSPGIMERFEAFIFFIAMMLLPAYFSIFGLIFVFLVLLTSVMRLFQFYASSLADKNVVHP